MSLDSIMEMVSFTKVAMVFQLAILEGLLSFDNALALAALVSDRLKHPLDRKYALLWGIWGAYLVRTGIVFIGVWLMEHEWVKFIAGSYLVWMAGNELVLKRIEDQKQSRLESTAADGGPNSERRELQARAGWAALWKTIVAVEMMDLMFSVDSVAVALAVSNEKWVLITGAVIGIFMMRIAASYFIKLIEKFPILIETAFILVGLAGLKVIVEVKHLEFGRKSLQLLGWHVPESVFLPLMLIILIGAILINIKYPERFKKGS